MLHARVVIAPTSSDLPEVEALIARAERRGFTRFALDRRLVERTPVPSPAWIVREGDGSFRAPDRQAIPLITVDEPREAEPAIAHLRAGEPIAVRWMHERVIPLENLVAARRRAGTLWVVTSRPSDLPGFLGALEHGADTVVVEVDHASQLDEVESFLERPEAALEWVRLPIRRVLSAGLGDRVIVDTTSLLAPDEGILVGSSAAVLMHIASEAVGSRYTRPRPFRVNAGAAHLYTLLANGETRYLSELVAGDAVLVARPEGSVRSARVGRIKIERRPLTLIEVEDRDRRYTAFLQEAETVRVSTEDGRVPTSELAAGGSVFAVRMPTARHLGMAVEETIEER